MLIAAEKRLLSPSLRPLRLFSVKIVKRQSSKGNKTLGKHGWGLAEKQFDDGVSAEQ